MEKIKKILDEQKHICQTEFDKRSKLIDGIWYVACEDVLNAPYPKQLLIHDVSKSFKITDAAKEKLDFILGHSIARDFPKTQPTKEWAGAVLDFLEITGFLK
jgi:hypothetical protein